MRKKVKIILILVALSIGFSVINYEFLKSQGSKVKNSGVQDITTLKISGYWRLSFIHVDGNWSDTAFTYDWCSGNGSWSSPYVIEDVIINASTSPTGHGIYINNSQNKFFKINNCTIYNADSGIRLEHTNNGTLANNNCSMNTRGIQLINSCNNNSVLNNIAQNNVNIGIGLELNCRDNNISENTANGNYYGIFITDNCDHNNITANTANNNSWNGIVVWTNENNNVLENTANTNVRDGIAIAFCDNTNISRNIVNSNGKNGMELDNLDNSFISGNTANNNDDNGIELYGGSYNNTFLENTVNNNLRFGIVFNRMDCEDNYVIGNNIHYNSHGLYIDRYCDDNFFYLNNLSGNVINVDDDSINQWDNGTIGNFWGDYDGVDADDDGIGDTPYRAGLSFDNYPIWDDGPHIIAIYSPKPSDFFEMPAPSFNLSINYPVLDNAWYTLDYGLTNYSFIGASGTLNQSGWDACGDGTVPINFYVNNTAGNFTSAEVIVIKDTIAPKITIISPITNLIFGELAPAYDISIEEVNLNKFWYTINGGLTNFTFTHTIGIINQNNWSATPNGHVIIRFYAMDLVGNVGFKDVIVIKNAPDNLICIDIIDLLFSTEEFVITFFIYDENDQGIGFALIQLWWDGIDVSHNIVNIGNGFYFVSLEPITVTPEEDPILFNMVISADGYQNKYYETYIAVDPETITKGTVNNAENFQIVIATSAIVGGIGIASVLTVLLLRMRRK